MSGVLAALLGGVGLFLLGTSLMTEGLKQAAGEALRGILQSWTRSALRGLAAGFLITALVRSSSAVTVAAIGFVNAGLLSLTQAVWVVFGTNVGTTTTAWLVAFVGIRFDIGALALPLLGVGMLLRLAAGNRARLAGLGEALAGFGVFFLGVNVLQQGFLGLAPQMAELGLPETGPAALAAFLLLGTLLTVLTQASSAAIAIVLTASAAGSLPLELAAAAVVGTNIGTTSTAAFATIGATAAAKRVAAAHILFNLLTGAAALLLLPWLVRLSVWLPATLGHEADMPTVLAVFHTLFNLLGVVLMWPLAGRLVGWLSSRFITPEEALGRPRFLDATLLAVPNLALDGLAREVARMLELAAGHAAQRLGGQGGATGGIPGGGRATLLLGEAVRGFIARLNAAAMPAEAVAALPSLLRALQHAETIARNAAALSDENGVEKRLGVAADWSGLRAATLDALLPVEATDDSALDRSEAAYQAVKRALLAAAAEGHAPVTAVDAGLAHAQRLRQMAAAAIKGRRRLRFLLVASKREERMDAANPGTAPAGNTA